MDNKVRPAAENAFTGVGSATGRRRSLLSWEQQTALAQRLLRLAGAATRGRATAWLVRARASRH